MLTRVLSVIVIFLSVFFMPFWVFALLALLGIVYFDIFVESIVLLLISDLLYGIREGRLGGIYFFTTICGIIIIIMAEVLKKKTRFYNK
jgi:hypothetical protein